MVLTDSAWKIGAKGLESAFLKGGSALTLKMIYESVGILFYEVRLILLFLTASLDINGLIIMVVSQETIWKAAHGGW
ncbi:Os09g0448900 [Oryza sativa Japonica Group]|uniref:Os09g0448900 protein n=1 Tax=Oryza sativa subsp. japonica TaxID=39947 RepID=Q67V62_ORYSJ|nr:unknown protein [Oryza sativa Japonica Group]BAH94592.1 Os09g0448900 [Oryza sativa Japonica Group]|eukprot:NP_001175864.1 Os09g0448900 [Oryza sativa Japonica Group]